MHNMDFYILYWRGPKLQCGGLHSILRRRKGENSYDLSHSSWFLPILPVLQGLCGSGGEKDCEGNSHEIKCCLGHLDGNIQYSANVSLFFSLVVYLLPAESLSSTEPFQTICSMVERLIWDFWLFEQLQVSINQGWKYKSWHERGSRRMS